MINNDLEHPDITRALIWGYPFKPCDDYEDDEEEEEED